MIRRSPHTAIRLHPLLAAALLALVGGCEILGTAHRSGEHPAVVVSDAPPPVGDTARVLGADVRGETLLLHVSYGGGCGEHDWVLYANTAFTRSLPPQTTLTLVHDANGDRCEALLSDTLRFDLSPALRAWRQAHRYTGPLVLRVAPGGEDPGAPEPVTITL